MLVEVDISKSFQMLLLLDNLEIEKKEGSHR